jgi:hypothetical protein
MCSMVSLAQVSLPEANAGALPRAVNTSRTPGSKVVCGLARQGAEPSQSGRDEFAASA